MKTKNIFNIKTLCVIFSFIFGLYSFNSVANNGMPENFDVSPQQLEKMETLMHEMQHFYDGLSPEEKASFESELAAEVEREQQKLASMSPEDQKAYVETAFRAFDDIDFDDDDFDDFDIDDDEDDFSEIPTFEGGTTKKETKEDESKKLKIKGMLDTIKKTIEILQRLLDKLSAVKPSAKDLIDGWIKKGYIRKWAGEQSDWDLFKSDLDTCMQKLHKIQDTDPKTGKYKYLDDPKKANVLIGQVEMLKNNLEKYEPNVEISDQGKVATGFGKEALKKIMSYLTDATTRVSKSADDLVVAFDPEAKKIMKEEEQKRKRAEAQARKEKEKYGRTRTTGKGDQSDPYGFGFDDNDYDDILSRYYGDSTPSYSSPSSRKIKTTDKDKKSSGGPSKKGGKGKGKDGKKDKGKKKKPGIAKAVPGKKKDEETYKASEMAKYPKLNDKDSTLKSNLSLFSERIDDLKVETAPTKYWEELDKKVKAGVSPSDDTVKTIYRAAGHIKKAGLNLKELGEGIKKISKKDEKSKKAFIESVIEIKKGYKEELNKVKKKLDTVTTIKEETVTDENIKKLIANSKELSQSIDELSKNLGKFKNK